MSGNQLTREEVARLELGKTEIRPRLAWLMVVVFLATAVLPPCLQIAIETARRQSSTFPIATEGAQTVAALPKTFPSELPHPPQIQSLAEIGALVPSGRQLREFEDRLNETSLASRTLGPWVGWLIKGILRGGDEQAYFGREGWLFYRQSVDSITGPGFLGPKWQHARLRTADVSAPLPQPDPLKALLQFKRQLAARNIELVVLPTPGKETFYPEKLAPQWKALPATVQNPSFETFKSELAKAGIDVFDPAPLLNEMKKRSGEDVYLKTDTHWAPPAMQNVAAQLASWLKDKGLLAAPGGVECPTRMQTVCNTGDIATMLNLPTLQRFFPPETVQTMRVLSTDGAPWVPDTNAPVLLMGDSFCNIYSLPEMGWGDSAGFAEHLSLALGQPIDRIVINAGGAYSARQELARQHASGRGRLAGKRVVVYQFATRELAFGDWRLFDLPETSPQSRESIPVGDELVVEARVSAVSRLPQPGSVPYKDCLLAIHLTNVRNASTSAVKAELLVYALGMRDNRWLAVSSLSVGSNVRCRLRDWAQVEKKYGSYNRAELDDLELLSLPVFWAEEVTR